jgi:sugar lactone lactonase YvrE
VDSEGNYWSAMYEGGRIVKLSPTGELLQEVELPVRCPTSLAFGGPDLRTLYVTSASKGRPKEELAQYPHSGKVLSFAVDVPGIEMAEYRG